MLTSVQVYSQSWWWHGDHRLSLECSGEWRANERPNAEAQVLLRHRNVPHHSKPDQRCPSRAFPPMDLQQRQ